MLPFVHYKMDGMLARLVTMVSLNLVASGKRERHKCCAGSKSSEISWSNQRVADLWLVAEVCSEYKQSLVSYAYRSSMCRACDTVTTLYWLQTQRKK